MTDTDPKPFLPPGTETAWGTIHAIGCLKGERYYWMIDKDKVVSMMPAFMVEPDGHTGANHANETYL